MKNIFDNIKVNRVKASSWIFCVMLLGGLMPVVIAQPGAIRPRDRTAILKVMHDQEQRWNQGDLAGFMDGYWRDDSLRFIGKSGITYGWEPTLANYKKGYPDKSAMGMLTFTILRVEGLGLGRAHVTGKWHLQRAKDAPEGYFTLLWRKVHGKWVIVADHSS